MKDLEIMAIVSGTSTPNEGLLLFHEMDKAIAEGNTIRLSLTNAGPMSTSFLNVTFGGLVDKYGFEALKGKIVLINFIPSHAERIRKYLEDYKNLVK